MKTGYVIGIIIALIILAIAIIVGALIIANSNNSNSSSKNNGIQGSVIQGQNGELPPETCKVEGTGCLDNRDCCGAMLCCRNMGANSGYCAISCA